MSAMPPCRAADFFVLRTPGLPLAALACCPSTQSPGMAEGVFHLAKPEPREALSQRLRELVQDPTVREALALASPDLASRLGAWRNGSLEPAAAHNLERALLKYLGRMSTRATPFGLFAGVSTGTWGSSSNLFVAPWRTCRKAVRLDWGVLQSVVERFEQEPEIRALLRYRPNTSLYARGGRHRYLERRKVGADVGWAYHLEAVEATAHLDWVLQQARAGKTLEELAVSLAQAVAVEPDVARSFLNQIIDAQLLCGDLQPALTSPDPLGQVICAFQANPTMAHQSELLLSLGHAVEAIQAAPPGSHPEGLIALAEPLAALGSPPETRNVLQVDLFRPAPTLALSPVVRRALEEGADRLRRLTPAPSEGPLERFRAAFLERYGTRWLPLLEVLDEESGLGFDGGVLLDSPLLEGLPFRSSSTPRQLTHRDQLLLKRLHRWQGKHQWDLDEADVAALSTLDPPPFPASFAALASLEAASPTALDQGDFHFWMEHYSGPTAARWLGRFASGDGDLEASLQRHLRKEEALRPEAVFAEVVHVPEGRMGNVLARPSLRDYEIPFLATAGVAPESTILPSELLLTVRGNRVCLASSRLGREVIPRLSSAHNFAHGPVVYRFLAHLQDQDGRPGGWSWGALSELAFLPRVTWGRQVLCKARWRIEASEWKESLKHGTDGAWGAFQSLRTSRGLPRFVVLTDADNRLQVDLDQPLWVDTLHHLVAHRSEFILTECFPDPAQALVTSSEGSFAHELVIPFESMPTALPVLSSRPLPAEVPKVRHYPPGSEWLYLKLYCGPASADRLLVELAPLLRQTHATGCWDRWHFVRYRDPDHHLRLRFHGQPSRLLSDLLPQFHQHLEEPLAQGLLWRWQVDTFEPEWERYGGPRGFDLAEAWFAADSECVQAQLAEGLTLEERWRAGLRQTDAIWAALGLSVQARLELARSARDGFRKEFADTGEGAVAMGARFRALRKELSVAFPKTTGAAAATDLKGLLPFRQAFDQGLLQGDLASLGGSLSHMHLNRMLRTDHRETEWVLMEFLVRLYESSLARWPNA